MPSFRLQIQAIPREAVPADQHVGERLVELVRASLGAGRGNPAVVVLRERAVEAIDPRPVMANGIPLPWFLAGMTLSNTLGGGQAEAVGLAGRVDARRNGQRAPVACVFLEWADNRWWHWQALLDEQGRLLPHTEQVRSALQGDPLPEGLGRWWAAARRQPVHLQLTALGRAGDAGAVH